MTREMFILFGQNRTFLGVFVLRETAYIRDGDGLE
jgi:hypothetical protein